VHSSCENSDDPLAALDRRDVNKRLFETFGCAVGKLRKKTTMKMPWDDLEGAAKVLVISVAILLVAAGMCGVQALILSAAKGGEQSLVPIVMITGFVEFVVMLVAGITAIGALVAWIATAIYNRFAGSRAKRDETQRLFGDSDKHDGPR
jgi:hypothetical protein